MTRTSFSHHSWLLALFAVLAMALSLGGHVWIGPDVSTEHGEVGPVFAPRNDCGDNWFFAFWTPSSDWTQQGRLSKAEMDRLCEERGINDMPFDEAMREFARLLDELARRFGYR